jgi:hypothetical protein
VPDPPLLRNETEASHAYLSMLLHIASSSSAPSSSGSSSSSLRWPGAAEAQQATQASHRLVELSYAVLVRFTQGVDSSSSSVQQQEASGGHSYGSSSKAGSDAVSLSPPSVVCAAFGPLVVSTLKVRWREWWVLFLCAGMRLPGSQGVTRLNSHFSCALLHTHTRPPAPPQALAALNGGTFQSELGRFFPVLTALITCDYATADVQRALSELFLTCVGPLLQPAAAAAVPSSGGGGGDVLAAPALAAVSEGGGGYGSGRLGASAGQPLQQLL